MNNNEKVRFSTEREGEELTLVGNYWEAESDPGIVMAHGFTGDKSEWGYFEKIAEDLNEAGYNVLAFDFGGNGESDDEPLRIDNQIKDLGRAVEYLRSKDVSRIGPYGHSQGGLVSLKNYSDGVDAIFLTSPVTDSLADYANNNLSERQRKELEETGMYTKHRDKGVREEIVVDEEVIHRKESLDQDSVLSEVDCPVMIVHGVEDDVVPLESSRKAARKLENVELVEINGLDHEYDSQLDKVSEEALKFFSEHLPVSET